MIFLNWIGHTIFRRFFDKIKYRRNVWILRFDYRVQIKEDKYETMERAPLVPTIEFGYTNRHFSIHKYWAPRIAVTAICEINKLFICVPSLFVCFIYCFAFVCHMTLTPLGVIWQTPIHVILIENDEQSFVANARTHRLVSIDSN